jgi:alpha-galactosidase
MSTRKKITFLGGGSYQWVPVLFRDIAVNPHLAEMRFVLHDIHSGRNAEMADVCRIIAGKLGSEVAVETEDDLDRALEGAAAVILCISTGGLDAMEHDIEIPKRYGIFQPVGDSTGPGGISRTLRNVPVVTDLVRRMESLCPEAWLLNLTNPMNQIVRAVQQTSRIKVVGLCHEFKSFMSTVQSLLGLKDWHSETSVTIGGINHFAWVKELRVRGEDGLELLRNHIAGESSSGARAGGAGNDVNPSHSLSSNRVKFSLFETYGLIPYPGDRHLVEFFPYYLSEKTNYGADFGVELTAIDDRRFKWIGYYKERISEWTAAGENSVPREPSDEALAPILASLIGGGPVTVQPATLPNCGQVANLPRDTSVETLASFGDDAVWPHAGGDLPLSVLALVHKHSLIQDLTVEAAIEGSREKALQAMLADPLNNSNDQRDIHSMLDELLQANAPLLPQFFGGLPAIRRRTPAGKGLAGKRVAEVPALCHS